jgi:hypothetical protein
MDASELLKRYAAGKTVFFGVDLSRADLRSSVSLGKSRSKQKPGAFPHKDLISEFLSETQKCRPIGKTYVLSGLQRLRSPRVTEER